MRTEASSNAVNLTLNVNMLYTSCNRCTVKCDVCGEHNDVRAAAHFHLLHGVCHRCVPAVVLTHIFMERFERGNMSDPTVSEDLWSVELRDLTIAAVVLPTDLTARDFRHAGLLYHKIPEWIQKLFSSKTIDKRTLEPILTQTTPHINLCNCTMK